MILGLGLSPERISKALSIATKHNLLLPLPHQIILFNISPQCLFLMSSHAFVRLDISSAQPSLQINLGIFRAGSPIDIKASVSSFIFRNGKRPISSWKPVNLHSVAAVATFETKSLVQKHGVEKGNKISQLDSDSIPMQLVSATKESEEMDEKERLRRMRISKANKGITPWNKGRKHSSETRERIRERTRIAMQNSKVKMKLTINGGHAQSDETKEKIAASARRRWGRRREVLMLQEYCHFEWQNLIAETSKIGFAGEEELQWDSYKILNEQLQKEWLESVERRKKAKPKGCKRAPKTLEQRKRISSAISAKWANPEYREKISTAKSRNRRTAVGIERKQKIKQSSNTKSPVQNHPEKKTCASENYNGSKTNGKTQERTKCDTKYKDPSASSKVEMIKNIRAQRATADTRKTEAIERARSLIAEAEMAMDALELAAEKSPIARASLVETRKIIAEAIRSLESLKTRQAKNEKNGEAADSKIEMASHAWEVSDAGSMNTNGTQTLASREGKSCDYGEDIVLNDDMEDAMQESGTSPVELPNPNGEETPKSSAKTKKWVRGRLIQVSEQVEDGSL